VARKPNLIRRIEEETGLVLREGETPGYEIEAGGSVSYLNLDRQNLTRFPSALFDADCLISLESNLLTEVPPELGRRPSLHDVHLGRNRIVSLPRECVEWSRPPVWVHSGGQFCIYLQGNPLRDPPPEVLERGMDAVRSWFDARERSSDESREVRLLVIGDGGAGKTSLIRRLTVDEYRRGEPQTHGIRIDDWRVSAGGVATNVHVWDFGGQEMMHSTHQFFLSHRSMYLVVLDGRRNEKVEYWLQHVRSFGGGSPVVVVLNKIDENPSFELNRTFLKEKYPNIVDFQRVSCETGAGVGQLRELLATAIGAVDVVSTAWPASWLGVRGRLKDLGASYVAEDVYEGLCREEGVVDADEQEHLAELLHDLGLAVHFPDLNLSELHVLDPLWVTDGVYRVLHAPEIADSGGLLMMTSVPSLFSGDPGTVYNAKAARYLVELMKKFELCYPVDDGRRLLFPELLPVQQPPLPEDIWQGAARLVVRYGFLPRSVFPRLMVHLHREVREGLAWRSGMVLENDRFATTALVRVDHEDRRIDIAVRGEHVREHLTVVRHALGQINESFEDLGVTELVPCICTECRRGDQVHYFDHAYLTRRMEKRKTTVDCELSLEAVPVEHLLWGLSPRPPAGTARPTVFLSYSQRDFAVVQEIALDLRQRGIPYWLDVERIGPGESISKGLDQGLAAEVILVCISEHQAKSDWSRLEWGGALTRRRVIPLLLHDLDVQDLPATMRDLLAVRHSDAVAYAALLDRLAALSAGTARSTGG
jgi:small GTP-binding protein